ncbi:MAG: biopolymer transporter ExbD [Sorangiineae bacterium]|nr:biopolymer transporter ExbD [Polyangiaceae bacterium]MEB2320990.1 biopolymer transporter ExbD [Sorangiineae bacterium]
MATQGSDGSELITGINVTPLVDVMLVLLVVLMVTAGAIAARSIPVDLPRGATGEATPRSLAIVVEANGRMLVDGAPVDPDALRARIRHERAVDDDLLVVVSADGAAPHRAVVAALDTVRAEGIRRLGIDVRPDATAR